MAINSIADLLALSWTHAYCTEGPEFLAVAPSASGGWAVGSVSLNVGTTPGIALWPDEIGTADLTQATAANQPVYNASSSSMGNRPTVECTTVSGTSKWMTVDFTDIAQPFEVVFVARARSLAADRPIIDGLGSGLGSLARFSAGTTTWRMSVSSAGATLTGGTSNTTKHLFRMVAGSPDSGHVDEVSVMSGSNGTNALKGLSIGIYAAGGVNVSDSDYCFIGIKSGALTAGERSDIHAFCQSHYGTP